MWPSIKLFIFYQLHGEYVTLNSLIASKCDSPDLNTVDMVDLTVFHNGPQKWAATVAPMKGDPLCN